MPVHLERRGAATILTLDRKEALNALPFAVLEEIDRRFDEVVASDARALIVTGAGPRAFCAGADIKELRYRGLLAERRGTERGQQIFARLDSLPIPSIAAINGYAFGGGLELALACTFRLATRTAKLGFPEIKLGLIPGYGGTQRLPRIVGEARALEIIMTGRTVDAEEAAQIGLVSKLIEGDPVDAALAFAAQFTGYGLPALGFARAAVQRARAVSLTEGLQIEADLSTLAFRTADAEEGMAAFIEKRPARFSDA